MVKYAIRAEGLGKEYIIGGAEQRHDSFREMLTGSLMAPFRKLRKLGGSASEEERFWALKDVSFNVEQGEVLGIIGRNGAGKSTLLKVLSRITSPTEGRVVTRGRVASLLEVGTGFHPELTGRENIYLNGAILGMSRAEIDTRFDEIVAFAEIERFLDTPVKRYSSGMYVRLAFAVSAHLDVDILIVDEVLAVGDHKFQQKCLGKMRDVSQTGRSVLFVSHNMGAVRMLCTRGLVLETGCLIFEGSAAEAVEHYLAGVDRSSHGFTSKDFCGPLSEEISFESVMINDQPSSAPVLVEPGEDLEIEVRGHSRRAFEDIELQFSVMRNGFQLFTLSDVSVASPLKRGPFRSTFRVPRFLLRPGTYTFGLGGIKSGFANYIWGNDLGRFSILESWDENYRAASSGTLNVPTYGSRTQDCE